MRGRENLESWNAKSNSTRLTGKIHHEVFFGTTNCFSTSQNFLGCIINRASECHSELASYEGKQMLTES